MTGNERVCGCFQDFELESQIDGVFRGTGFRNFLNPFRIKGLQECKDGHIVGMKRFYQKFEAFWNGMSKETRKGNALKHRSCPAMFGSLLASLCGCTKVRDYERFAEAKHPLLSKIIHEGIIATVQ